MKKFIAILLCVLMLLSMLPVVSAADAQPADIWDQISELEEQVVAFRRANTLETRTAAYTLILDQVISLVEASDDYVPGSLTRNGNFFFWLRENGDPCGYGPYLRAKLQENAIPGADPDELAAVETVSYAEKGGYPSSLSVAAFQPFKGIDSSFTAQYENECNSIAAAMNGTGTTYKASAATIDAIGNAMDTCAVVIFDSHGDTDYEGSWGDYTSRANTSYLLLTTGSGVTAQDKTSAQGEFGTYYHAFNSGSYWFVDGTAITNHMSGTSPNGLLWMAICLGMATSGMEAPFRAKGVEVVYGYSQSVTFAGDYAWEAKFWQKMKAGEDVKTSIAYMKQQIGCPDPYESSYPAYPIVVSSEDVYPGHGNVDANQTVHSTWTLFTQFLVNAVSNNEDWGTVLVNGKTITALPKTGYEVVGYQVLSGSAAVTQNGNVFTVNPESDCTIEIEFAPRDPSNVYFHVPAGMTCENVEGYINDSVVLPTPQGELEAADRSYRFIGWTTEPLSSDTTELPSFVKAGTSLTLAQEEYNFYALYTYFIPAEGQEDGQFRLVTEPQSSWAGEYVISWQGVKALDASGKILNTNIGGKNASIDLAEIGCEVTETSINNVPAELVYVIEPVGDGTYTIKMQEGGYYLSLNNNANALTTSSACVKKNTHWNISMSNGVIQLRNAEYNNRYIQYKPLSGNSGNLFRCFQGDQENISIYLGAEGDRWYTCVPGSNAPCQHSFGDWTLTTAPTCTQAGEETRVCSLCHAKEHRPVEALGHDFQPVPSDVIVSCTETKYVVYQCSRCEANYTEEIPGTEHQWNEGEVTTEATYEAAGVMTYTCTVCGATREEEIAQLIHKNPFEDISAEDAAYNAVIWAYYHEPQLTAGTDPTHFSPEKTVNRAEAMVFLWATCGRPDPTSTENPFMDVKETSYYYQAVLWAVEKGITSGTDATHFSPKKTCNRSEIIQFLYAAKEKPACDAENPYSDVPAGKWYEASAIWAYELGLERGTDGKYEPKTDCTRASVVTYLYRYETGKDLAE